MIIRRRQTESTEEGTVGTALLPDEANGPASSLRIFLNYRREDSSFYADRLYDDLQRRPAAFDVFRDMDKIEPGADFVEVIEHQLDRCEVVLALIGQLWVSLADAAGRRRLDDPADYVRLELEKALDRGVRLIPVLVQGAEMPSSAELPESLQRLVRRHAVELSDKSWRHDVDTLAAKLEQLAVEAAERDREEQERRASEEAEQERQERDRLAQEVAERIAKEEAERKRRAQEVAERERQQRERLAQEVAEREREEREAAEKARAAHEAAERRAAREAAEREREEREAADRARAAQEASERERAAREEAERQRLLQEQQAERKRQVVASPDIRAATGRSSSARRPVTLAAAGALVVGLGAVIAFAVLNGGSDAPTAAEHVVVAPMSLSIPRISGIARARSTLTAHRGSWEHSPAAFAYQWQRCGKGGAGCMAVAGATSPTYRLADGDVGHRMRISVTASNTKGSHTARSEASPVIAPALRPPANSSPPTVSGTAREGSSLTVAQGAWRGTKPILITRVWLRCNAQGSGCAPISGEHGTSYLLSARDVGRTIRVEERASNEAGRKAVRSNPTPVVRAEPTPPPPPPQAPLPEEPPRPPG